MRDLTLVVMTRDRVDELLGTLERIRRQQAPIIVVDNGSTDGTPQAVRERFPDVEVVALAHNVGVEARNLGVRLASTPYVAFNDDDSWWAAGALERVVERFDANPRLGAVAAHIVVEPGGRDDPVALEMAASPLRADPALPGVPVLGFLACAAAVRRSAFLDVGGFERRFHFAGEEQLLAADLAAAGWGVRYLPDVRVHHRASAARDPDWRRRRDLRNDLWFLWLRRPPAPALRGSLRRLRAATPRVAVLGLAEAVARGGWILQARAPAPPPVEAELRRLDAA